MKLHNHILKSVLKKIRYLKEWKVSYTSYNIHLAVFNNSNTQQQHLSLH